MRSASTVNVQFKGEKGQEMGRTSTSVTKVPSED